MKKTILILLLLNLLGCSNLGLYTHTAIVGMCSVIGVKNGK